MSESTALIRSRDLFAWQHPKLPKLGNFSAVARWRGRLEAQRREAEFLAQRAIEISIPYIEHYLLEAP